MKDRDPKLWIRKNFSRASKSYDEAAALQRAIADLLLERLRYLQTPPWRILEGGAGTCYVTRKIYDYCPKAFVVASDISLAMLESAKGNDRRWFKKTHYCAGDMEALPFKNQSFDAFICNLALQWCNPQKVFSEVYRVLKPNGLLLCSTFGPDTLLELRQAFDNTRVHTFVDMHDLGSLLMQASFVDPVLDSEWHIRYYPEIEDLYRELKGLGAMSVLPGKSGLGGRSLLQKAKTNYEVLRTPEGLPSTYEVIFIQAWVGPSKNRDTESTISLDQLQRLGNQKAMQSRKMKSI